MPEIATIQKVLRRTKVQSDGAKRDYYFGSIPSDQAKMLTFVPVNELSEQSFLEERVEEGSRRPGSATRMGQFGDFLRENPLSVVPPVVLSGRGKWVFEGDDLGLLRVHESAAIVDGQHRVGGFVRNWEKYQEVTDIDFILLPDLALELETREFLTINTTQKNVVASLTDFLLGGLGRYRRGGDRLGAESECGLSFQGRPPKDEEGTRTTVYTQRCCDECWSHL